MLPVNRLITISFIYFIILTLFFFPFKSISLTVPHLLCLHYLHKLFLSTNQRTNQTTDAVVHLTMSAFTTSTTAPTMSTRQLQMIFAATTTRLPSSIPRHRIWKSNLGRGHIDSVLRPTLLNQTLTLRRKEGASTSHMSLAKTS